MKRSLVLSLAIAGVLAGGVVGVIVGASTVPQLHACVQKTTSLMRYVTGACKPGEKLLTWSVQGPQGDTGAPGPQGPAGTGGDSAGPVNFYLADDQPLTVTPGTYLVDATIKVDVTNGPADVTCYLSTDSGGNNAIDKQSLKIPTKATFVLHDYASVTGTLYTGCTSATVLGGQQPQVVWHSQIFAEAAHRLN